MPALEKRLIYDNAACRIGKGTDFARGRLTGFMRENFRKRGGTGYFLKCDIRKYFDNIDHEILKTKLRCVFDEPELLHILDGIIDSYEVMPGKGLPLGNQTSQWFAIYYLDGLDRFVKEQLGVKYYTRYMDDMVLLHHEKAYLTECLREMKEYIGKELRLEFNHKTQIFPARNGVEYIGFHFYQNENGGVIRKLSHVTKDRFKHRVKTIQARFEAGEISYDKMRETIKSYRAHLAHGHTFHLMKNTLIKTSR